MCPLERKQIKQNQNKPSRDNPTYDMNELKTKMLTLKVFVFGVCVCFMRLQGEYVAHVLKNLELPKGFGKAFLKGRWEVGWLGT